MSDRPWRRRWVQQPDGTLAEIQPDAPIRYRLHQDHEPRLHPISDIKKCVTGDIAKLNQCLLRISRRLERVAKKHRAIRTVPGAILISLFRKTVNTFEGIEVLKRRRLIEESWILLRVLLEAHVNFVYYLSHDPTDMVHRYLDASMLDKLKHLREVNFYEGTSLEPQMRREDWEKREKEIKERYTEAEFVALRKNGFTGLPFQQRAKAVGMEEMYQYCYRIASRSVHTFDPAETPVFARAFRGRAEVKYDLLRARREQLDANQNMLLGRVAYFMSEFIRDSFISMELILIGVEYEKFRDQAKTLERKTAHGSENKVDSDEGSEGFYVWRI